MQTTIEEASATIRRQRPSSLTAFTGSGISQESGIPTFRGSGGLWRSFRPETLATPQAFEADPVLVWEWYEWRRDLIRKAQPNRAHEALARTGATVITQNVDGLHQRAGSVKTVELHGNIFRTRCVREGTTFESGDPFTNRPPRCACGSLLRPDVVWFGESLAQENLTSAATTIAAAGLLLIIGTSGVVYPAAGLVQLNRGLAIEINPEPSFPGSALSLPMKACDAVPLLVETFLECAS